MASTFHPSLPQEGISSNKFYHSIKILNGRLGNVGCDIFRSLFKASHSLNHTSRVNVFIFSPTFVGLNMNINYMEVDTLFCFHYFVIVLKHKCL